MTSRGRFWARTLSLTVCVTGLAGAAHADLKWFGVHGGYYYDFQKGAVGLDAVEDIGNRLNVGLSGDYIFTRGRETFAGHLDLHYDILKGSVPAWAGGGFGIEHINPDGPGKAEVKFFTSAFAGLGFTKGPWMPYVQARALLREKGQAVLTIGFRF